MSSSRATIENAIAISLNNPHPPSAKAPPSEADKDKLRIFIERLDIVYDAYDHATDEWRGALDAGEPALAEKLRVRLARLTGVIFGINREIIKFIDNDETDVAIKAMKRIAELANEIKQSSAKKKKFLDDVAALAAEIKGLFDAIKD